MRGILLGHVVLKIVTESAAVLYTEDEVVASAKTVLTGEIEDTLGADLPGSWLNDTTFSASFDVSDIDIDIDAVSVNVEGAFDVAGNPMTDYTAENEAGIDT